MRHYIAAIAVIVGLVAGTHSAQARGYHGYGGHGQRGWEQSQMYGAGHGGYRPYCPPRQQIVYIEPRHPRHHHNGYRPYYKPAYVPYYAPQPRENFGFFVRY